MFTREQLTDDRGKYLTQGLFLEIGYPDTAVYTLKDYDHTYEGRVLPSIKRLYLEMADPTEYKFANEYFLGWKHWQRCVDNKLIREYIDEWRLELEMKLRQQAVDQMIKLSYSGSYQAAKWLADRGWDTRAAGRPTKAEKDAQKAIVARVASEYSADVVRLKGIG